MLFPQLSNEPIIQQGDKTRLDASSSFVAGGDLAGMTIEIRPESGNDFVDISDLKYLDWSYGTSGAKVVTLRITSPDDPASTQSITSNLLVLTCADDGLFSKDSDLQVHSADVMAYLADGRSTFKDFHRRAQTLIMKYLEQEGARNSDGSAYTKAQLIDKTDLREWSAFMVLKMIFEGQIKTADDVNVAKAKYFAGEELSARTRSMGSLKVDLNSDGTADPGTERVSFGSIGVVRS